LGGEAFFSSVRAEVSVLREDEEGCALLSLMPRAFTTRPGVARRLVTFFCFAKRKSPKKRRPAVWVPALRFGQPALLDSGGGPQNSLRSNNCGPDPASICAARPSQNGAVRISNTGPQDKHDQDKQGHAMACPCGFRYSGLVFGCLVFLAPTPSVCAEERRARRIRDRDCLSRRRVERDPAWTEHRRLPQSEAQGSQTAGSPFGIRVTSPCEVSESPLRELCLLSFGEAKESELPPGNPRPAVL